VPAQPLAATTRVARGGRRIHVVDAALVANGQEVCRASALLLRRSGDGVVERMPGVTPAGPEGLETAPLGRSAREAGVREGLHTTVEARWVQRRQRDEGGPAVAWLRLPVPLVAGEENTPLVRVATVSDFVNALGSMRAPGSGRFINVDITLYLERPAEGEWIGFEVTRATEPSGLGVSRATLYDASGQTGAVTQAVLANDMR
jgi:hypothetical protein